MEHYEEELLHAFGDATNQNRFQFLRRLFDITPNQELPRIAKLVHNAMKKRCKRLGTTRLQLQGTIKVSKAGCTTDDKVPIVITDKVVPLSTSNEIVPVPILNKVVPVPISKEAVQIPKSIVPETSRDGSSSTVNELMETLEAEDGEEHGWYENYAFNNILALDCEKVEMFVQGNQKNAKGKRKKFDLKAAEVGVCDLFGNTVYRTLIHRKQGTFRENRNAKNGFKVSSLEVDEAKPIETVRKELLSIFQEKLIIGVDLAEDFSSLDFEFGDFSEHCFDLQWHYKDDKLSSRGKLIRERWSLKRMSKELLGEEIQNEDVHSALDDAKSTAKVFREVYMKIEPKPTEKNLETHIDF